MYRLISGCTWNSRNALSRIVPAKLQIGEAPDAFRAACGTVCTTNSGVSRLRKDVNRKNTWG